MLGLLGDKILHTFILTPNVINAFLMPSGQIILKVNQRDQCDT